MNSAAVYGAYTEKNLRVRYAIVSDTHANVDAFRAVLDRIDELGVDQIIHLGDVIGYNATPNECCELIRERNIPTILGNHDAVACHLEEPWGFNPVALEAALWTRENTTEDNLEWVRTLPDALNFGSFVAVHGAPKNHNTYLFSWEDVLPHMYYLEEQNCDLCLVGHTHSPAIFSEDGVYTVDDDMKFHLGERKGFFINPGAVGQPRDGNPQAAFGIYDDEERVFEQVRVPYPIEKAAERVLEAGLPPFLAERLALGR